MKKRGAMGSVLFAVAALAAASSAAQTNDPNLTQQQLDCINRGVGVNCKDEAPAADGAAPAGDQGGKPEDGKPPRQPAEQTPPADKQGGGEQHGSETGPAPGTESGEKAGVVMPALIADLFPATQGEKAADHPLPTPDPRRPSQNALPQPVSAPAALPAGAPPRAIAGDFVPDEVLATVDGGAEDARRLAAAFGLQIRSERSSALLGTTLVRFGIPDGRPVATVLAELAADGRAGRRAPNHVYVLQQAGGIANYAFGRIALDAAAASGENVRVAVIDTAADEDSPALKGVIAGRFDAMPGVPVAARDHGTAVDGLIAGTGPLRGMAPGAKIYHARAFEDGRSTMDAVLAALDWAAGQDVRIVNMSFVGPRNDLLGEACARARAMGMVLVAAAGNNGPGAPYGYPAAFDGVVAVTATDDRDGLMPKANRGPYVFISAPGVDIVAPNGGGSDLVTGTSFAAAVASGAIANLLHADPTLSADSIEKALAKTAKDLGPAGRDDDFGYGLLDVEAARKLKE